MRPLALSLFMFLVVLLPKLSSGQIVYRPTPPPLVTAASAEWQIRGEPIFFAGNYYLPTGPTVFFNGALMARVGEYRGVPLFVDTTLEAYSVLFVPVAGGVMRPYERPRGGDLAGTSGSRPASWPGQLGVASSLASPGAGVPAQALLSMMIPEAERYVAAPAIVAAPLPAPAEPAPTPAFAPTIVQSIPPPTSNAGIWIEFAGERWQSAGPATAYSPDRFEPVGDHAGFPVYRERGGNLATIFVTAVAGGPLAPYVRR